MVLPYDHILSNVVDSRDDRISPEHYRLLLESALTYEEPLFEGYVFENLCRRSRGLQPYVKQAVVLPTAHEGINSDTTSLKRTTLEEVLDGCCPRPYRLQIRPRQTATKEYFQVRGTRILLYKNRNILEHYVQSRITQETRKEAFIKIPSHLRGLIVNFQDLHGAHGVMSEFASPEFYRCAADIVQTYAPLYEKELYFALWQVFRAYDPKIVQRILAAGSLRSSGLSPVVLALDPAIKSIKQPRSENNRLNPTSIMSRVIHPANMNMIEFVRQQMTVQTYTKVTFSSRGSELKFIPR